MPTYRTGTGADGGYACGGPPWWVMIGDRADAEIDSDARGDTQRFGRSPLEEIVVFPKLLKFHHVKRTSS